MKILLLLLVCAAVTASPKIYDTHAITDLIEILLQQLFAYIKWVIINGLPEHGIPVLDPLNIEDFHLNLPLGIMNIDIELEKVHATGFSQFVVHKSDFNVDDIWLDVDITFPELDISADKYALKGDFFTALPLYGMGKAKFIVNQFNVKAKLYLMQSENGNSILIKKIENVEFNVPNVKCNLTGVIGGGDIDQIVNVLLEDVIFNYVNRFNGAIAAITSKLLLPIMNPFLAKLDSWRYIEVVLRQT